MEKLQKKLSNIGEPIPTIAARFEEDGTLPRWSNYSAVSRFKSVRRAIRRGKVDVISGIPYPNRPFNNRKPTRGRKFNELRKAIYEQLMHRTAQSV